MIMLYFFLVPLLYIPIKLILFIITNKFGKISYKGFSAVGFKYDNDNDLFYTSKNAWQKQFGYCHMYDVMAPKFMMIVDTEPIRFYYNNKNWLITFWKGQYGITTGAEIGIYNTKQKIVDKNTLYFPANKDEMLDMSFDLYKKDIKIESVKAHHWWLAGFKLGMFSKPNHLKMEIILKFPNREMLDAFLISFRKKGYKQNKYKVIDNTFYFTFKKPKTHKVWTRSFITDSVRQFINYNNTKIYDKYISDITSQSLDDKLIMIEKVIPEILKNPKEEKIENNLGLFLNDSVYSKIER